MENFISALVLAFVALFPLVNPIGAIPVFCTLTTNSSSEQRKKTALKTAINVFFILLIFYFVGEFLLEFFGISLGVLKIAGGLIVANTAWEMVTSKSKLSTEEHNEIQTKEDISFTPMALPLLSGPGSIGVAIGLSVQGYQISYTCGISAGILLMAVTVYIALLLSLPLFKLLGKTGVGVLNRIMGFFILAIAVQLIVNGIFMLIKN
ncbi:MAG: NAAT family transporter [Ignavibacteriae bacterium]|nr:NAAT family transporter [Ignavibacteriota bacterium]